MSFLPGLSQVLSVKPSLTSFYQNLSVVLNSSMGLTSSECVVWLFLIKYTNKYELFWAWTLLSYPTHLGITKQCWMFSRTELHFLQSYGPEHLLIFSNLQRVGLLTEQAPEETFTAMENKVSNLVMDKAAGEQTAQVAPPLPLLPTSRAPWERGSGD